MPQQDRGVRRVNQILDKSAEVFSELGYEAATTNIIATRANTSIGSLYQFFPNKHAILIALADRYDAQLIALLDRIFADSSLPLTTLLDQLIEQLTDFYNANPAFQPMFYASQSSKDLVEVADGLCRSIVERVNKMFASATMLSSPELCLFYAEFVVHLLRALIPLIKQPSDREKVVPELKRMVQAYLASTGCFDIPTPSPKGE